MTLQQIGKDSETPLGPDFRPSQYDVICHQRDKETHEHNHHFRKIINDHLELYSQCKTRLDKSVLVLALVELIRERGSPGGGFVKLCENKKGYVEIGDRCARQKVAHALRKLLTAKASGEKRKSSAISKKKEKEEEEKDRSKYSYLPLGNIALEAQQQSAPTSLLDMFLGADLNHDTSSITSRNTRPPHTVIVNDCDGSCFTELEEEGQISRASLSSASSSISSSSHLDAEDLFQDLITETIRSTEDILGTNLDIESIF